MFLSPDPYIQSPDFSQNYNRYGYCLNNPLKYTDPSGEFIFTILAAIFAPPLLPAAVQLDMAWMQGGFMEMANGGNFWAGAGKGLITGAMTAGLSFLNVPGMILNGLLHAGGNVLANGISNAMYGQDFFKDWGFHAVTGFAGGAYSGYQLSKEGGLNYWWGGEVKYGRTQWSFNPSEKPYEIVQWDINNVGSKQLNDCVPTTFAEANDYFGGTTSYDEFRTITNYQDDIGTITNKAGYETMLSDQFKRAPFDPSALADPQMARELQNRGYLLNTNMPHSGIRHADNLRSISYYHSGKVVMRYRIGSYKLSSVNDSWWFYLLRGLK